MLFDFHFNLFFSCFSIFYFFLKKTLRGPSAGGKEKIELGKFRFQRMTLMLESCVHLLWGGTSLLYEGGRQNMSEMGREIKQLKVLKKVIYHIKQFKILKKGHLSHLDISHEMGREIKQLKY